ncbi:TNF receptor-associated factor 6-like isoform X2 [Macrosteles quadrilineatus]|uniref:TNF receptor-associated factor 6-like isoform X2 n=1 Tax=Macrosteles quadrilineatus TaxID=74068 RepID=UPI0023E16285|nr:TNF receptor-associated factor 6-like isoform X2 [Macrosteles quadrilineatus]XP_054262415.1 TNF receptor-associated factor 6-like isoform X2 [Macrosteles quadrilineatus]
MSKWLGQQVAASQSVAMREDLDKHFQTLRKEFYSQINQMYLVMLKTSQKLANIQEVLNQNNKHSSTLRQVQKTSPRGFEFKENNYTVHEDNVTGKKVFSYYWKIGEMQNNMMMNIKQQTLRSPGFYVNGGYRMYIKMFPHQDKGNIYIHVGLAQGEHDDELNWPFTLKHRVTIVDQSVDTPEDIMSQIWDPRVICSTSDWHRPTSTEDNEECVGFGFTQDTLLHNSYIYEDSLVVKLDVFI